MKRKLRITLTILLTSINVAVIIAMVICAYSTYLKPQVHPYWSWIGMLFVVFMAADIAFIPIWLFFRRHMLILPVTGLMTCAWAAKATIPFNPFSDEDGHNLKVITYNVMNMGDPEIRKDLSKNPILDYIIEQDADIVCLQEAIHINHGDNMTKLRKVYPYIELQLTGRNFMAVLSKYPVTQVDDLNDEATQSRTYAYHIAFGDDTMLVINNHFESFKLKKEDKEEYVDIIKSPESPNTRQHLKSLMRKIISANKKRGPQVDFIYDYIARRTEKNIILCGDFNDVPVSYTHNKLTKLLNDSYTRGGNSYEWSYNRNYMYFRIDNIMVSSNIKVCKSKVDKTINTSDHYPLISWLKVNK